MSEGWKQVPITPFARLSINPLRKLKFEQKVKPNPAKEEITLQLGDPSVFGNFPPPKEVREAVRRSLDLDVFNYNISHGRVEAREAVAEYSKHISGITANDVVLGSGCGHVLELFVMSMVAPGENLLIPRPCYNYRTWTDGVGIVTKFYDLDPQKNWEIDLENLESMIDEKTRAILVNNPGNPCGSVFSKAHILEVLKIAERHKLPIIADEVYEFMVFPGYEYHSFATLTENVPIISCSALSKRFLCPGIRMGWGILKDPHGVLKDVRQALHDVTGRILGANSTVQHALPEILRNTPKEFFDNTMVRIARHATTAFQLLVKIQGLKPIMPRGSMYMMIGVELEKFPDFSTIRDFVDTLIEEQSVLLFPSIPCFNYPGYLRIVLTVPEDLIVQACERINEFCQIHYRD